MITFKKSQHRGFLSAQISTIAVAPSCLYTPQIRGCVYQFCGSCILLWRGEMQGNGNVPFEEGGVAFQEQPSGWCLCWWPGLFSSLYWEMRSHVSKHSRYDVYESICLAALLCPAPSTTWEQPHQNSHMSEIPPPPFFLLLLPPFKGVSSKLTKPWEIPIRHPSLNPFNFERYCFKL